MSWQIDRRTFLRGAAGAALPLPFLNLMQKSAFGIEQEQPPLRFMTLFKPNGVHPPSWNISGGTEYDFRMSGLMQPFAKHKEDLLILDNMGDFGFSSHSNSTRRFLSGHHKNRNSASMDQLIADKISGDTPHRSLELTTEGLFQNQIGCSYISYDHEGQPIPRESDPQLIFDRLFRSPLNSPVKRQAMTSLIDRVRDDAKSLSRKAGTEDRETLDQYLSVVRETEKRLENIGQRTLNIDVSMLQRPDHPANLDEQVESMIDLIALALWTDSTRCITYMLGNSNSRIVFDFLGIHQQHHYLSHFFRNFSRTNLDALLKISLWHMEKFDYLLTRLKSFKDHNGTLLDHTLVLYGSGMGHSDNHTATRIPIVLAGGKRIIKTGRYVRYSENQQLGRLHLSLLHSFGVETQSFAESSKELAGLNASDFAPWKEQPFESWVKIEGNEIEAQGRLRMSENLDEAKIFYLDIKGEKSLRIDISFKDFHHFNIAYHCGTPVNLRGTTSEKMGQSTITKITGIASLLGNAPGSANG